MNPNQFANPVQFARRSIASLSALSYGGSRLQTLRWLKTLTEAHQV